MDVLAEAICMAGERELESNTGMGKTYIIKHSLYVSIFNLAYVPLKRALTVFNLERRPLARIQMLDCFGQFPQRTERRNEHILPWNFHSPPFPGLPVQCVYFSS